MRFEKLALIVLISICWAVSSACVAQGQPAPAEISAVAAKDPLKGLKKAGPEDLDRSKQIMLDPESTTVYFEDGKQIKGNEFMQVMMSGNYVPEPYVDEQKEIKAFVLRPATEEEKKQMQSMFAQTEDMGGPAGKEAKPFTVRDIKGNKYSLEKLKGKIVVVNFWFMECKPCRMEMPELNKVVDDYKRKDIVFLGMSTNSASQLNTFLATTEFKYNVIPDSGMVAGSYGVTGFPTHVVIDRDSKIAYFASGFGPGTVDRLKSEIEKLVNKKGEIK
jgi:peroxiredoxin